MTTPEPLTPAQRAGCWADMFGVAIGTGAAVALLFDTTCGPVTTPTDAQFYTFVGGMALAFAVSVLAARRSAIIRVVVVAWWVMFAWLLLAKNIACLFAR